MEKLAYDRAMEFVFTNLPEFNKFSPKHVRIVSEGGVAIGSINKTFISLRFHSCTAILFKDPYNQEFGLFHVYPGQEPEKLIKKLTPFADGFASLIQGSDSTEKSRIIRELSELLGIQITNTISVDTHTIPGIYPSFHVAYRPKENQVFVASISLKNVLTFPAFTPSLDNLPVNS